jgi:perosamine synthetase
VIRLTIPSIEDDDLHAVAEVLRSGMLVQGANVAAWEEHLARVVGVRHAVAVSSGTAALHLAMLALGVGPGDLVLTTAYSWVATANVIRLCGAEPVFVDIDARTFNLSPDALEAKLKDLAKDRGRLKRVKAILPVHAFGLPADMPAILATAGRYDIPVVEDAACALGAACRGKPAGAWGKIGCFSFHPRKAVTTGEGGACTTDDDALARRIRILRNHGLDPQAPGMDFVDVGFNYRMTDFQAALGRTQTAKLDRILAARRRLAAQYDELLADVGVQTPVVPKGFEPAYQTYVVLLPKECAPHRAEIIRRLREEGVETTIGTIHIPLTTFYRAEYGYREGDFPATDDVFTRSLALPLHERLTREDQTLVAEALRQAMRSFGCGAGA